MKFSVRFHLARLMMKRIAIAVVLLAAGVLCGGEAATVPSTVCQRATCPVKVDGVLDEEVWRLAKPLSPMRDLGGGRSEFGATA